jgi:ribonuclease Z
LLDRAKITFHSTSVEAAMTAKNAGVGKLVIGHFSARYKDLIPMLNEAQLIFPETELAIEGMKFSVKEKNAQG